MTTSSAKRAAAHPAVSVPIGAIQIESPVRRKSGETFDFNEMKRVFQWARDRKIGLHLDGARLYLAAAYSGTAVRGQALPRTSAAPIPKAIRPSQETTAEAVATLGAQFPWLLGAEQRRERRR